MKHVRKTVIIVASAVIFYLLAVVILIPLSAELNYINGCKHVKEYKWAQAEKEFLAAIRKDPLNSNYQAGFADYLQRKAIYMDYKIPTLLQAEERAIELNPVHAKYYLSLGEVQAKLFLSEKEKYSGKLKEMSENFDRAIGSDPNGVNVSYSVGYIGMNIWEYANEDQRGSILERLKRTVASSPELAEYIYPKVWEKTKDFKVLQRITPEGLVFHKKLLLFLIQNELWQFSKEEAGVVNFYTEREDPGKLKAERAARQNAIEALKKNITDAASIDNYVSRDSWRGADISGKNAYGNGDMCWTGTIDAPVKVPAGKAVIYIEAMGTKARNVYPYMLVELDGEDIGETFVNGEWKMHLFDINTAGGIKVLSVTFTNDGDDKNTGEDRNLFVGRAEVR
jgi:tetratricopeptide (TPR) repeat protein